MSAAVRVVLVGWVLALLGCADDTPQGSCVPGRALPCTCDDGRNGQQRCDDARRLGACVCVDAAVATDAADGAGDLATTPDAGALADLVPAADATEGAVDAGSDAGDAFDVVDVVDVTNAPDVADVVSADIAAEDRPSVPAPDVVDAPTPDVVAIDLPAPQDVSDVARGDVGPEEGPFAPCDPRGIVDVTTIGERAAGVTRLRWSNRRTTVGSPLRPPAACAVNVDRVVVFRYTPQRTGRLLLLARPVTDNFEPALVDPVLWRIDRCAPDATVRGCNNDAIGFEDQPSYRSDALLVSTEAVPAGVPLLFAVGSVRGLLGRFDLTVAELTVERPHGASCDRTQLANVCAVGASCLVARGVNRSDAYCIPDGTILGRCRATGTPCDPGLGCRGSPDEREPRCLPAAPLGGRCGAMGTEALQCERGSCASGAGGDRCVDDGAPFARCRRTGTPCDDGFACSRAPGAPGARCVPPRPLGASCAPADPWQSCGAGASCIAATASTALGACLRDGSDGGRCRVDGAPCDAGLACSTQRVTADDARCRPARPANADCDYAVATNACVAGTTCTTTPAGPRCLGDGSRGGRCRLELPFCDAGLACDDAPTAVNPRCITQVAPGDVCDLRSVLDRCATGTTCQTTADGTARCVAQGAEGAYCRREGGALCDPGSRCPDLGGRCAREVALDAACPAGSGPCVAGARCALRDGVRTCQPQGSLGTLCRFVGPLCDEGLLCFGSGPVCVRPATLGAPCDSTTPCATGLRCEASRCVDATPTVPCAAPYPPSLYAPCPSGLACAEQGLCSRLHTLCFDSGLCAAGTSCDGRVGSPTRCSPDGVDGGRCLPTGSGCAAGTICVRGSSSSVCRREARVGEPCDTQAPCAPDLVCVSGAGRCVARTGRLGEGCRVDAEHPCDDPLECRGEYCRTPDVPCAMTCAPGTACTSGACVRTPYRATLTRGATAADPCRYGQVLPLYFRTTVWRAVDVQPSFTIPWTQQARATILPLAQPALFTGDLGASPTLPSTFPTSWPRPLIWATGSTDRTYGVATMVCYAEFGAAPLRRAVFGWRMVNDLDAYDTRVWTPEVEIELREDGVIEYRSLRTQDPTFGGPLTFVNALGVHDGAGGSMRVTSHGIVDPFTIRLTPP